MNRAYTELESKVNALRYSKYRGGALQLSPVTCAEASSLEINISPCFAQCRMRDDQEESKSLVDDKC